jgi:hypothetical protein
MTRTKTCSSNCTTRTIVRVASSLPHDNDNSDKGGGEEEGMGGGWSDNEVGTGKEGVDVDVDWVTTRDWVTAPNNRLINSRSRKRRASELTCPRLFVPATTRSLRCPPTVRVPFHTPRIQI